MAIHLTGFDTAVQLDYTLFTGMRPNNTRSVRMLRTTANPVWSRALERRSPDMRRTERKILYVDCESEVFCLQFGDAAFVYFKGFIRPSWSRLYRCLVSSVGIEVNHMKWILGCEQFWEMFIVFVIICLALLDHLVPKIHFYPLSSQARSARQRFRLWWTAEQATFAFTFPGKRCQVGLTWRGIMGLFCQPVTLTMY